MYLYIWNETNTRERERVEEKKDYFDICLEYIHLHSVCFWISYLNIHIHLNIQHQNKSGFYLYFFFLLQLSLLHGDIFRFMLFLRFYICGVIYVCFWNIRDTHDTKQLHAYKLSLKKFFFNVIMGRCVLTFVI